jgi:hypothetical protein
MKRGQIDPVLGTTEGKLRTMLKSALRPLWRATSRKTYINSVRYKATNPQTGRLWNVVDCVGCGRVMGVSEKERRPLASGGFSKKERSVFEGDHCNGITPLADIRQTLGNHFHDMIYGDMQILCYACHKERTAKQSEKKHKSAKKKLASTQTPTKH